MDYKEKYIEYKHKYLQLKYSQNGGNNKQFPKDLILTKSTIITYFDKLLNLPLNIIKHTDYDVIEENYKEVYKLNKITDSFSHLCRMKCKVGDISPYQYYNMHKDEIDNMDRFDAIYHIYRNVKTCTNFNISRVIYLFKYLFGENIHNVKWLDMSAGWGDRLIGAICLDVKEYTGTDPNLCLKPVYRKIIHTLVDNNNKHKFTVHSLPFEQLELSDKYDIAFTSPPFFDLEIYNDEQENIIKNQTPEEWTEHFILPYVKKAFDNVVKGGYVVLYIENHKCDYIEDIIKQFGKPKMLYMKYDDKEILRPFFIWRK